MRFAVVNTTTGFVENIIEAEPGFSLSGRTLVQTDTAGPGWTWNGTAFQPPAPPPGPTRWKVRKSTIIERMTDAELQRYEAVLQSLTARQRHQWNAVTYVWSDDPRILGVADSVADEPKAARVAALLAMDPGAQALPD